MPFDYLFMKPLLGIVLGALATLLSFLSAVNPSDFAFVYPIN
jgi:hypothetical protein